MLRRVKENAASFARLSLRERIDLLKAIRDNYLAVLDDAVREGCRAKGLDPESPAAGEEWFAHGFSVVRHMRLLLQSLEQIEREGAPRLEDAWIGERANGALAVRVYPLSRLDALAFPGIEARAHLAVGVTREQLRAGQAPFYRKPAHEGRLALILGAGNVASIPPRDALTKMFNEGKVCVLKMNPVNEYLGPHFERAFQPAIDRGYFAVVYGGGEVGSLLTQHPLVDEVHITGSDKTHDVIVWGPPGAERTERMKRNEPLLAKEITSELGNVSPVIVVPGPWSEGDFQYQGRNIAGMVTNNASFNCNAAKLLVVAKGWEGRGALLKAVETALSIAPARKAYYPGASERFKLFTDGRAHFKELGRPGEGELPWGVIRDVDPNDAADRLFNTEAWCSLLAETALEPNPHTSPPAAGEDEGAGGRGGVDPVAFLAAAVKFVNDRLWGTLNAMLIVHPKTAADPRFAAALEKAIEDLRYGTVALNAWPAVGFTLGSTPWGGHPSSTLGNIQSGRGWTSNTLMLEGVEKVVIRAPFKMKPKPVWFPDHKTGALLGRRAVKMEARGSWLRLPGVAIAALRG